MLLEVPVFELLELLEPPELLFELPELLFEFPELLLELLELPELELLLPVLARPFVFTAWAVVCVEVEVVLGFVEVVVVVGLVEVEDLVVLCVVDEVVRRVEVIKREEVEVGVALDEETACVPRPSWIICVASAVAEEEDDSAVVELVFCSPQAWATTR